MNRMLALIFLLVLVALLYQFYQLYSYHGGLSRVFTEISNKLKTLGEENLNLQADLEYFQEPENLVEELRSRFNYKKPGEKLIIVVPPKQE